MYCCLTALFSFELAEVAIFLTLKTYRDKWTHDELQFKSMCLKACVKQQAGCQVSTSKYLNATEISITTDYTTVPFVINRPDALTQTVVY